MRASFLGPPLGGGSSHQHAHPRPFGWLREVAAWHRESKLGVGTGVSCGKRSGRVAGRVPSGYSPHRWGVGLVLGPALQLCPADLCCLGTWACSSWLRSSWTKAPLACWHPGPQEGVAPSASALSQQGAKAPVDLALSFNPSH